MVEIIERTSEEKERARRIDKLAKIAKDIFPSELYEIKRTEEGIIIHDLLYGGFVKTLDNLIIVKDSSMFNNSLQLAQEYESLGESDITIKKDY